MATRHAQSLPTNLSYPHRLPALSLQTYDSDTSFLRLSFIPISRVQLSSIHFEQNHRHLRVKQLSLSTPTLFPYTHKKRGQILTRIFREYSLLVRETCYSWKPYPTCPCARVRNPTIARPNLLEKYLI